MSGNSRITLIDPAPVFLVMPRPHVIVDTESPEGCPILCQTIEDGRMDLLSVVLPRSYPPTSVAFIFTFALPQHECDSDSECYLYWGRRKFEYWQDIQIVPGAYVKLYEWTRRREDPSSTSCGSTGNDEDAFSWTSEYDGGNTATPISEGSYEEDSHNNDGVPHQDQATSRTTWQTAGRWTRRFRSEDHGDETNLLQDYIENNDLRDFGTIADTDDAWG